jgi:two-component system chemotaxis response regulator CheY
MGISVSVNEQLQSDGKVSELGDNLHAEEVGALLDECRKKLGEAEDDLVDLADNNIQVSADFVNRVFRAFHSVKGAAGYLRYDSLKWLSHLSESVLAQVRDGKLELSSAHAEVLLSSVDRMKEMVAGSEPRSRVEASHELESLNAILNLRENPVPEKPKPAAALTVQREGSPAVLAGTPPARRLKVLVVEDDFSSRVVLQGLLSKHGECHIAVNGKEAVEAFRYARRTGQAYDLICMDILMPEMNGEAAVEQIRALEMNENVYSARVKIFMTTAIQDMKTILASFKALCDAYLFKPIEGEKLEEHLRSFGLIR